jgi:tol-pal system protein YbgF
MQQRWWYSSLVIALFSAGCAVTPPEEDPVQIKLRELEGRIDRIERVVSNQSLLDMAQRVDKLESNIRGLNGQVDELQNNSNTLAKQQRDLYSDLDRRLQSSAPPTAPLAQNDLQQQQYNRAFEALKSAQYPAAIDGFRQFLQTYPDSPLAENAQYWLGEAFYVTRDYAQAAEAFSSVQTRWPQSRKAADAMLKLGFSQFELRRFPEARTTLSDVTQRFPGTEAARLAADRLSRLPQ